MPLLERSVVSQREEFCRLARAPGANVSALCRRFEVGRTAAYRWLKRLETQGVSGLVDRSRRPLSSPRRTPEAMEAQVLAVRRDHPTWGGRKIERVLKESGTSVDQVDLLVPHQANQRILDGLARRLGIDESRVISTVERHANTSAASIPLAMAEGIEDGRIRPGQLLLLEAMGGGLTWGAAVVRL